VSAKPRQPDDFTSIYSEINRLCVTFGFLSQYGRPEMFGLRLVLLLVAAHNAAHGGNQALRRELGGQSFGDNLAILHDNDTVGSGQDLAQNMGNDDDRPTGGDKASDIGEQLGGQRGIQ